MLVGFMANFKKPKNVAYMTAVLCKYEGIDLVYMNPDDVNVEKELINGRVLRNGKWVRKVVGIPKFLDIAPYCFTKKNYEVIQLLKDKSFLSDNRTNVIKKDKLESYLKDDHTLQHLMIPTKDASDLREVYQFLGRYKKVVLKPVGGIQGKNIYIVEEIDKGYQIGFQTRSKIFSSLEFDDFITNNIMKRRYIVQKYISSRTLDGHPFDCRVHVEKNGFGQWESARNYVRIGLNQKVVSNVNQGGAVTDLEPFLKANFGSSWQEIKNKIISISTAVPEKVEKIRGTHIMSLGLDVGIDESGEIYLFEVNDGPATVAVKTEVARLRSRYYKYVLEKMESERIRNKREKLRTEVCSLEQSKSWKLTKLFRLFK